MNTEDLVITFKKSMAKLSKTKCRENRHLTPLKQLVLNPSPGYVQRDSALYGLLGR